MKTLTKTYKVYSYDELKGKARDNAKEKLCELNITHDWWHDDGYLELSSIEIKESKIKLPRQPKNWHKLSQEEQEILDRAKEKMNAKISGALMDLKENYEYLHSDEACKETAEANDYFFLEDGTLFRG